MSKEKVSLIKCTDYSSQAVSEALLRHFELLGGLDSFISRGDKVLIKPNMIAPMPAESAVQTHGAVIVELAKIILDFGAKPFVADSPAWADAAACAKALVIDGELNRLGVEVRQLNKPVKRKLEGGTKVGISSVALEADKIINLPKLKMHQQLIATIAVKNMFGCVSGKAKAIWHYRKGATFDGFCTMLIDIYKLLNPVLTIVDAIVAMEGAGPLRGEPKEVGYLVAGVDPIAIEMVCCDLIGISPEQLPIFRTAKELGFWCSDRDNIEILGDMLPEPVAGSLVVPPQVPLRFTPVRIARSILRQIFMLVKLNKKS